MTCYENGTLCYVARLCPGESTLLSKDADTRDMDGKAVDCYRAQ